MLQKAIAEKRDIEMRYFTHSRGEFTKRRVTPLKIDGPYFVGHCHERDEERTFRCDRVASIRLINGDAGRTTAGRRHVPPRATGERR
ncbi:MAG: WYL domain-containing protein [Thermoplasmata archaeon]